MFMFRRCGCLFLGGRCRVESLFFLGASLSLCWSLSAALLHLATEDLRQLMPAGTIFDSLLNFASRDDRPSEDLSYQIYVEGNNSTGPFVVYDWKDLTKKWGSKSSFSDLLIGAMKTIDKLPSFELQLHSERIIFILHNHPKMASTTLRRACWENLKSSCGVMSPQRNPMGYSNTKDLAALISKCENTHHFCVMGWHFHPDNFPNATPSSSKPITFIHLFPFRNFDDWTTSAMKQIFVGHSEAGCNKVAKRLEKCDGWLELDYEKYSKHAMSKMLGIIKQRAQQSATHHFLLYDYSQLNRTLAKLGHLYQVPMLRYLDMRYKQFRRDGSCPNKTLSRFHECFDERLLTL